MMFFVVLTVLSVVDPRAQSQSTNKAFMLNNGQSGTVNNALTASTSNFFVVNSNLLNQSVSPSAVAGVSSVNGQNGAVTGVVTNNFAAPLTLTSNLNVGATFVFDGDSMTAWTNGDVASGNYNDYPDRLLQLPGFYFHHAAYDFGVSGQTAQERWANYANAAGSVTASNKILFYWAGYNDVYDTGETDSQIEGYLQDYWSAARGNGYFVVAFTFHTNASWTHAQMVQWTNVTTWIRGASGQYNALVDEAAFMVNPNTQLIGGIHLNASNNAALAVMISTNPAILNYLGTNVADSTMLNRVLYADVINGDNSNVTVQVPMTASGGVYSPGAISGNFLNGNTGQINVALGIGTAASGNQGWVSLFNPSADADILTGNNAGNEWLLGSFNNQAAFGLYSYSWPGNVWLVDQTGDVTLGGSLSVTGTNSISNNIPVAGIRPGSLTAGNILSNSVSGGVATAVWVPSPVGGGGGGFSPYTPGEFFTNGSGQIALAPGISLTNPLMYNVDLVTGGALSLYITNLSVSSNGYTAKTNFASYDEVTNAVIWLSDGIQAQDVGGSLSFWNPTSGLFEFGFTSGAANGTVQTGEFVGAGFTNVSQTFGVDGSGNVSGSNFMSRSNMYTGDTNFAKYVTVSNRINFLNDNEQIGDAGGNLAFFNPTSSDFYFGATTFGDALGNIFAGTYTGSGADLTSLNGSAVASGMIGSAYLPGATSSAAGIVKPDNATITVSGGVLSAAKATSSAAGIVEPDNTSITVTGGVMSAITGAGQTPWAETILGAGYALNGAGAVTITNNGGTNWLNGTNSVILAQPSPNPQMVFDFIRTNSQSLSNLTAIVESGPIYSTSTSVGYMLMSNAWFVTPAPGTNQEITLDLMVNLNQLGGISGAKYGGELFAVITNNGVSYGGTIQQSWTTANGFTSGVEANSTGFALNFTNAAADVNCMAFGHLIAQ